MTLKTKSTVKMLCVRAGIANKQLSLEAQKLMELYEDPDVAPEQKQIVKAELERAIKELEEKVTTRKMREAKKEGDKKQEDKA